MSEDEWVDAFGGASIADIEAYRRAQNGSAPDDSTWDIRNLADVDDSDPEPPTLGGLNLLYPSKRHVFSGPQEAAKTLAAYIAMLAVIREGGRVLLIDFEMGERDAKRRLLELGAKIEEFALLDYVEPETVMTAAIAKKLVERNPRLVVVDASAGAYDLQGLDDNKRSDVERFSSTFMRPFWKAQIATLVIDHVVKNVEARQNYAIGSERKVGGVDVHLGFTVVHPIKRGAKGVYKITTHKDRPGFHKRGKLADMELVSDPETHAITWEFKAASETDEEHPFRPTVLMERVSRYLESQVEPVSQRQVEKDVTGKGAYIRQALSILRDEGYVEDMGAGNTLVRAYREEWDLGASPSASHRVPEHEKEGASLRPSPYGGDAAGRTLVERDAPRDALPFEDDDGIPF